MRKYVFYLLISYLYFNAFKGYFVYDLNKVSLDVFFRFINVIYEYAFLFISIAISYSNKKFIHKIFISFLLIYIFISLIHLEHFSLISTLNGLRDFIPLFTSLVLIYYLFEKGFEKHFLKNIFIFIILFGIIQIPISVQQYLSFGSGDLVTGTLGRSGSGILTLAIFLSLFFIIVYNGKEYFYKKLNISKSILFFIILLPSFINETKITFVLLLFMGALLFITKKLSVASLSFSALIGTIIVLFENFYSKVSLIKGTFFNTVLKYDFISDYLFYQDVYVHDISRFTKIMIVLEIISNNVFTFLFGMGFGIFRGGSVLELSDIAVKYGYLIQGTKPLLFVLLFQGGIIFTIYYILAILIPLLKKKNLPFLLDKYRLFLILFFLIVLPYSDAFASPVVSILFSVGYIMIINKKEVS